MNSETFTSQSAEETRKLAHRLVTGRKGRIVFALHGELGSGKTCFVQGIAGALDCKRFVTSPTFTIMNEYRGSRNLYHMDLYRIRNADEVLALGFEDYLENAGIVAVEWAEKAAELFPADTIHVTFANGAQPDERIIRIEWPASRTGAGKDGLS